MSKEPSQPPDGRSSERAASSPAVVRREVLRSEAPEIECRLPVEFDLQAFIARIEKVLSARVRHRPVRFSVEADPKLPRMLRGSPSQLGQLLVVLAGDAIQQTERGVVSLSLRLDSDLLPPHDEEEIPIQAEIRCPAMVIVGTDWEDIQPGGVLERDEERDGACVLRVRAGFRRGLTKAAPGRFSGLSVLVVDDSAVNRRLCQAHLMKLGCVVTLASDGREALSVIGSLQPNLVLMDCQMPGMDGLETTRAIRGRGDAVADTTIIALTGVDTDEEREACIAVGMDDFLAKPFHAHELVALLDRHLMRKAA